MSWADGTEEITNSADIIDSREVIARIEYLTSMENQADSSEIPEDEDYGEVMDDDMREELEALKELAADGETNLSDWEDGETLIRDSYFETYAEELADDIGAIDKDASWPICHIDWEAAAESLQQDYIELDFDGVTYWARS